MTLRVDRRISYLNGFVCTSLMNSSVPTVDCLYPSVVRSFIFTCENPQPLVFLCRYDRTSILVSAEFKANSENR